MAASFFLSKVESVPKIEGIGGEVKERWASALPQLGSAHPGRRGIISLWAMWKRVVTALATAIASVPPLSDPHVSRSNSTLETKQLQSTAACLQRAARAGVPVQALQARHPTGPAAVGGAAPRLRRRWLHSRSGSLSSEGFATAPRAAMRCLSAGTVARADACAW